MAESTPYPVQVITPEGPAFTGDAQIVVVPGDAGQLGILANHAPLISSLKPGETHLTDAEGREHRFATGNGYIQVRKNEALVLVGEAVPREEIDAGEGDVFRAEREVAFSEALVRVSEGG
jgi:F-type H+-transporting ATPase subunit epsilon